MQPTLFLLTLNFLLKTSVPKSHFSKNCAANGLEMSSVTQTFSMLLLFLEKAQKTSSHSKKTFW